MGDVGRAKQLLAEGGYRDEASVPVIVNDQAQLRRELEVVSGQFARVGVKVEIQMVPVSTQVRTAEGFSTLRRPGGGQK